MTGTVIPIHDGSTRIVTEIFSPGHLCCELISIHISFCATDVETVSHLVVPMSADGSDVSSLVSVVLCIHLLFSSLILFLCLLLV
jgi:hypothetical protein